MKKWLVGLIILLGISTSMCLASAKAGGGGGSVIAPTVQLERDLARKTSAERNKIDKLIEDNLTAEEKRLLGPAIASLEVIFQEQLVYHLISLVDKPDQRLSLTRRIASTYRDGESIIRLITGRHGHYKPDPYEHSKRAAGTCCCCVSVAVIASVIPYMVWRGMDYFLGMQNSCPPCPKCD